MILSMILIPIFTLILFFLNLLPNMLQLPSWLDTGLSVLTNGLCFFPNNVFTYIFINVSFWLGVHLLWAVIEWVYHKIPGIS